MTYSRILVPLDGSQVSEQVLPEIEKLASALRANVSILRVAYVHAIPSTNTMETEATVIHEAEEYVHNIEEQLKAKGLTVDSHVRYEPDAGQAILEHCKQYDIDLIAMSSHGRTGLTHLLFGSVAEKVVHHTTVPVLLVRAH